MDAKWLLSKAQAAPVAPQLGAASVKIASFQLMMGMVLMESR